MNEDRIIELIAAQAATSIKVDVLKETVDEIKSDIKNIKYNLEKNKTAEIGAWKKVVLTILPILLGSSAVSALFNACL